MLIFETAINRYLAMDPELLDKMAGFHGKVIKLEITGIDQQLYLFPGDSGIHIKQQYDGPVDTVLRGSPIALFKMGVVSDTASLLLKGEVEISGDTRLGHQFKNVIAQMDIDWAEPLSRLVGDDVAYQLQTAGRYLGQWGRDTVRSFATSLSEYLQEESRDVVTETELEIFNDAVDQLRDDVDRLQARVDSLNESTSTK